MGGDPTVGRGATVRKRMGPVAPEAGLKVAILVGEFGLAGVSFNFPPAAMPEVRLLGLTMRTIEGAPETTAPLLTGMGWPLLDSKIILLPVGTAPELVVEVVVVLDVALFDVICKGPPVPPEVAGTGALM